MAYPPNQFDNARSGFLTPRAYGQGQPIGNIEQLPRRRQGLLNRIGSTLSTLGQGTQQFLSNFGGRYVPPGMELTDLQKGELAANVFRSMGRDAQGNRRDETTPFLAQIAAENEFGRTRRQQDLLRSEMGRNPLLTESQRAIASNLPDDSLATLGSDLLAYSTGSIPGGQVRGSALMYRDMTRENADGSPREVIGFQTPQGKIRIDGVDYDSVPENLYEFIGTSMGQDPYRQAAITREVSQAELEAEIKRLQDPNFIIGTANLEGMKQAVINNANLQSQDRIAQLERLTDLGNEIDDAWLRTSDMESHREFIDSKVDEALDKTNWWSTGFRAAILRDKPGTDAYALANLVLTIEANLGFDKLEAMRLASPTGGALGQVSERELEFLKGAIANLNIARSEEDFTKALNDIKASYKRLWDNQEQRFRTKFGVEYADPDAIQSGRDVIAAKVADLTSQGYSNTQIYDWLYSEDAEISGIPASMTGGLPGTGTQPDSGTDPVEAELQRRGITIQR